MIAERYARHWYWHSLLEPQWTRPFIMWVGPRVTGCHFERGRQ